MLRRLATVVLAALALGATASSAYGQRPPGVDELVSFTARSHVTTLASPRVYTKNIHTLLLAFVVAGGTTAGERVKHISGDGLHWSPLARSDRTTGATEVWQARANRWLAGRVVAKLAAAAYPASITIVAYGGASSYVAADAARDGHASTPKLLLKPTAGSMLWAVGLAAGQRPPVRVPAASASRRIMWKALDRHRDTGAWIDLTALRTSRVAHMAGAGRSRSWNLLAVDVVVPGLKRLIEEGLLTAYGPRPATGGPASVSPRYCPPNPAFEVGVMDDPVFLGLQPAMSPARGFEVGARVFGAHLLRLNVIWGEVKKYGWAPYDRAVRMARENCWAVHLTIMATPAYSEGSMNSELSARNYGVGLFASFVSEIASRYAGQVARFSIGDEPNEGLFMVSSGSLATDLATYDRLYIAGYKAVKAVDPSAQIVAGELGGKHIYEWLGNVATLPSNGVAVHPYALTNAIPNMVEYIAPVPLLVTEEGVPASSPNQLAEDREREEIGRRAGVHEFVFYQLSRADPGSRGWNTGIE